MAAVVGAGLLLALAPGIAKALAEWWTPASGQCPTFDSADACQAWCGAEPSRCGGSTECTFRTGTARPQCALPRPDASAPSSDGWQRPGTP